MSVKLFKDVIENQNFILNNETYTKIAIEKVSCCRSINAFKVSSNNEKILVKPDQEVEVSDE